MRCLIIGSGDMCRGIARQYRIHCSANFAYHLAVARSSRGKVRNASRADVFYPGVPYVDMELALEMADIVILAIPSSAFQTFIKKYIDKLRHCILVDISNPTKRGENLASVLRNYEKIEQNESIIQACNDRWSNSIKTNKLSDFLEVSSNLIENKRHSSTAEDSSTASMDESSSSTEKLSPKTRQRRSKREKRRKKVRWVKAFNDCGAVDLLSKDETSKARFTTCMCGNDPNAVRAVRTYAEEALGFDVITFSENNLDKLEKHQSNLGHCWKEATIFIMAVFVAAYVYVVIYLVCVGGVSLDQLPVYVTNKAVALTAVTGFSWVQLPGIVAKILITWKKSVKRNRTYQLPHLLVRQLLIRKHIGLLALFFLAVHAIMGTLIFNEVYSTRSFNTNSGLLHATASWSMFFGIFGFMLYLVVSIASIPGVSDVMTSVQFQFCFGVVIWAALVFGMIHIIAIGAKSWTDTSSWPGGLPPISMVGSVFPLTVVFLKVLQELFCRYVPLCFT